MTRHATVAELVRRRCLDADLLLEMLGVTVDGQLQPDDERDYGDVDTAQLGSRSTAAKAVTSTDDMLRRPDSSSAPDALRNLPPVEVVRKARPIRAGGVSTPRVRSVKLKLPARRPAPRATGSGRNLAECGTYGAYRRHLRNKEPIDPACAEAAREQWRNREGRERYLSPCGTYTAKRRHIRNGEQPCDLCATAKFTPSTTPHSNDLKPCGTEGAYRRHLKYGTPVCVACRAAHNERNRQLEAEKRNAA